MRPAKKGSAAERTYDLPGVSTRPQAAANPVEPLDGPRVRIVGCSAGRTDGKQSVLAACDHLEHDGIHTLCGLCLAKVRDVTLRTGQRLTKSICQACRVEASKLRAVIVR